MDTCSVFVFGAWLYWSDFVYGFFCLGWDKGMEESTVRNRGRKDVESGGFDFKRMLFFLPVL